MTTTQLFNGVTGTLTGSNNLYTGTLANTTSSINVLLRVKSLKAAGLTGVSLYFMTSPTDLSALTINQLKALGNGVINDIRLNPTQIPGEYVNKSGELYTIDGVYFAAWFETDVSSAVETSAWANEY